MRCSRRQWATHDRCKYVYEEPRVDYEHKDVRERLSVRVVEVGGKTIAGDLLGERIEEHPHRAWGADSSCVSQGNLEAACVE